MRDTYSHDELHQDVMEKTTAIANTGMRHSIRSRRSLAQPAEYATFEPAPAKAVVAPKAVSTPRMKRFAPQSDLPRWHELTMVQPGAGSTSDAPMPVMDAARDNASVRAFDLLRTRLRQTTQEHGWTNIAIISPTAGCGSTFTAVNLALSLSRISDSRTVLMDMNLRNPGVAQAFDMTSRTPMTSFLAGHTPIVDHMVRVSDTLALGLNNTVDNNASETLQAASTARTLEQMRATLQPELVIYDMPAMLTHDDVSAFLPQLDGVLLVSDGTQTMGRELMECERLLQGQAPLLGVVLNRARSNSIPRYA